MEPGEGECWAEGGKQGAGGGSRRDANTQRQTLASRRGAKAMEGVIRGIEKEG